MLQLCKGHVRHMLFSRWGVQTACLRRLAMLQPLSLSKLLHSAQSETCLISAGNLQVESDACSLSQCPHLSIAAAAFKL